MSYLHMGLKYYNIDLKMSMYESTFNVSIYVTQRGIWCPSGELGNNSTAIIKGYRPMEKNMTNRLILLENFTKVEFYEENVTQKI